MTVNRSRRNAIAAGLGLLAVAVAGCTKAVQSRPAAGTDPAVAPSDLSTSATPGPVVTLPPAPSSTGSTEAPARTRSPTRSETRSPRTSAPPTHASTHPASATAGPARQIAHGPRNRPQVALTFHGFGDIAYAREILQIAHAKHAHLTVMAVGTWLAQNPGVGREILVAGHDLGNHTLSHLDINSLPPDGMRTEVVGCRDILERTTGTPGSYFRQSQSQTANGELLQVAGKAGYRVCLSYDLDSMDWTDPGAKAVRANVAAAGPGSIVSMHLGHSGTVAALPGILDDLTGRGLSAVTVTTLLS